MAGVFRFSNAVSDIRKFIQTYKILFKELSSTNNFTHDDATNALIKHGLVSSSGAIGKEAIKRSRRDDRSRDPLYNQLKMYSEIYRMLGWYEPGTRRTNFNISDYGSYIYEANGELLKSLFELNVLHIVSPNPLVEIRSENILRPFPLIMKLLEQSGGWIHRDEIILTVLACENDRVDGYLDSALKKIEFFREDKERLEVAYNDLMKENGIKSSDTLRNYTRFIMATLKWLDLAKPKSVTGIYGDKKVRLYKITKHGSEVAKYVSSVIDIRHEDIEEFDLECRASFAIHSVFNQLGRIGYDLDDPETQEQKQKIREISTPIFKKFDMNPDDDFLYFAYQEATAEEKEYSEKLSEEL